MATTDIEIINANGLDYYVKDKTARDTANSAIDILAYREDGNTASQDYPVTGTPICWKGKLYATKIPVTRGSIWSVGTTLTDITNLGFNVVSINKDLVDIRSEFTDELTANGKRLYMDYKNGKYGYNLSANRGADTFFPFRSDVSISQYTSVDLGEQYDGKLSYYTVPRECQVLAIWVHGHQWQQVYMSVSSGNTVYSNTDYYGGGSSALFTQVPQGAVITFRNQFSQQEGESNRISATIYMSAE